MTDDIHDSTDHAAGSGLGELQLDAIEARILGCLVEKEATTPEQYPLTQNAVLTACNQKTSRDPVMQLEAGQGNEARGRPGRPCAASTGSARTGETRVGSRADRFEHRVS